MTRLLALAAEVAGLVAAVAGAAMVHPGLGLMAGGAVVVAVVEVYDR